MRSNLAKAVLEMIRRCTRSGKFPEREVIQHLKTLEKQLDSLGEECDQLTLEVKSLTNEVTLLRAMLPVKQSSPKSL